MAENKLKLRGRKAKVDRLRWIYESNNNRIDPGEVVADAANPDSPLHDAFVWDDTKAAHEYRIGQAREMIRHVRVEIVLTKRSVVVPFYLSDGDERADSGYETIEDVGRDAAKSEQVFLRELRAVQGHLERADAIGGAIGYEGKLVRAVNCVNGLLDKMSGGG